MTSTPIRCSGCNTRFRVRLQELPRHAKCPRCGSALEIPSLVATEANAVSSKRHGVLASQHFDGLTAKGPASGAATDERQESENAADSWTGPTDGSDLVLDTSGPQAARSASTRASDSIASQSDLAIVNDRPGKSTDAAQETTNGTATKAEEPAEDAPAAKAPSAEASPAKPDAAGSSATSAKSPKEVLDQPVGQDFNQIRIQEVVDYLTESTGVTFQLDMKSLWFDQGTTRNVPVTLQAETMPVREFLDEVVVKRLKAAYLVRDDKIVITSRTAGNKAVPADNR